jgi:Fe-S cluster assembly ATP-binding protein
MLEIKNLHVTVDGKAILHAIMGPNGSGKSTLAYVLAGREGYEVTDGSITYEGRNLLDLAPEERAREGIFLAFQYPVEIPGVGSNSFLKAAVNAVRKHRGLPEYDAMEFLKLIREKRDQIGVGEDMLKRSLNVGFSGGEKKQRCCR